MRKTFILTAVAFLSLFTLSSTQAAPYTFTKIAETSDGYSNFTRPSVNSSGTVAFGATFAAGGHLFTSTGGVATPIFDQTIKSPSINDSGQTSFIAGPNVYRLTGPTLTTIYNLPSTLYNTTLSNSGNVYFTLNRNEIPDSFLYGNGGQALPVDGALGLFPTGSFLPAVSSNDHPALSSPSGISLFGPQIPTSYTEPNFFPGGQPSTQNFASYGDADINASQTVVFSAFWGAISHNLYRFDNGVLTRIATGNTIPAINDQNIVAALFTDGTKSLKAGIGAPTDTVLSVGDPFMGSTITDLQFTHEGLSDGNQLAFTATLADGRTGIYLTAVPEPAFALFILPALALQKRRRQDPKRI
jgi:hypothetical protein